MPAKRRNYKPGSEAEKLDQLVRIQRALRELERDGHVSDPQLAGRIRAGWHPGVEMAVMTTKPDVSDAIKTICLKSLLENVEAPKAAQLRLDASNPDNVNITVVVAPWAGLPGPDSSAPKPIAVPAIDVVSSDAGVHAHRMPGSIPTPAPTEPLYQVYEIEDGRPVKVEAPAAERRTWVDEPYLSGRQRPVLNPHTGLPFQGTPRERPTPVETDADPFGRK